MKSIIKHFECEISQGNIVGLDAAFYQGKPVFLAAPFAKALGYANTADALKKHCKSLIKLNYRESRELGLGDNPRGIQLIGQGDAFRLIMRSSLPSAERVQDWVCEVVLPALMETGTYSLKQEKSTPSNGLPEYRKAKALKMEMEVISSVLDRLPHLGDKAKQAAYASVINRSAGFNVIPLLFLMNITTVQQRLVNSLASLQTRSVALPIPTCSKQNNTGNGSSTNPRIRISR